MNTRRCPVGSQRWCTEDGCHRLAVLTVINPQTGNGGHLCQDHAEAWAAGFLLRSTEARMRANRDRGHLTIVPGSLPGGRDDG